VVELAGDGQDIIFQVDVDRLRIDAGHGGQDHHRVIGLVGVHGQAVGRVVAVFGPRVVPQHFIRHFVEQFHRAPGVATNHKSHCCNPPYPSGQPLLCGCLPWCIRLHDWTVQNYSGAASEKRRRRINVL